jgi:hypothetical protein
VAESLFPLVFVALLALIWLLDRWISPLDVEAQEQEKIGRGSEAPGSRKAETLLRRLRSLSRALTKAPVKPDARQQLKPYLFWLMNAMLDLLEGKRLGEAHRRRLLEGLGELARNLSVPEGELAEHLSRLASKSVDPLTRVKCLTWLQEYLGPEAARAASLSALGDPNLEVRLQAAVFLGDWEAAVQIAALKSARSPVRERALGYVLEAAPRDRALQLLNALLEDSDSELRLAALRGFKKLGSAPLAERLTALCRSADREWALAAIDALGAMGGPSAEAALISLLYREDEAIRIAAIRALGSAGSATSVEALLKHAKGFWDSERRQAARLALSLIRARLHHVEPGRLALAQPATQEGGLSVAAEPGALSLEQSPITGEVKGTPSAGR